MNRLKHVLISFLLLGSLCSTILARRSRRPSGPLFIPHRVDALNDTVCGKTAKIEWSSPNAFCFEENDNENEDDNWDSIPPAEINQEIKDRIAAGSEAEAGKFPSYVKITTFFGDDASKSVNCGGTIVNKDLIMTAAHCLKLDGKDSGMKTRAVRIDAGEVANPQIRFGKASCTHPYYNKVDSPRDLHIYDLALIQTYEPFVYNDHVQPACIATEEHNENTECYIVGRGVTNSSNPRLSSGLNYLPVKRDCGDSSDEMEEINEAAKGASCYKSLDGGNGCQGDSGGPVYCMDKCRNSVLKQFVVGAISMALNEDGSYCSHKSKENSVTYAADLAKMANMLMYLLKNCRYDEPSNTTIPFPFRKHEDNVEVVEGPVIVMP